MTTETEHRVYEKLRDIVERHGGTMIYEREGYLYGAWVISLNGKSAVAKATGEQSFPELDRLFVPMVVNPETWDDRRNELLDDAEEELLAWLK